MGAGPLVSVVTPVYNGERYLAECIESILRQTFQDWQYVIVNNCSTDRSLEIAQRYAEKDTRIRVSANEQFVDAVRSQNIAFRQLSAESTYCKMVHADDWLFPDCLQRMVEIAEAHPSVGIVGAYRLDGAHVGCDGLPYPSTVVSGRELCRRILLGGPGVFGSPTSILFRSECIRARPTVFDEADFHSDTGACFDILQTWDFGFVHQVLTYTRRHEGAQTSFAERVNSYMAGELRHLIRYGPVFLSADEYTACLRRTLDGYRRFLAKSLLREGGSEVWMYHRRALGELGYTIGRTRIAGTLLREALRLPLKLFDGLRG